MKLLIVITVVNQFSKNINIKLTRKEGVLTLSFFLFSLNIYANDYLKYNFIEKKDTYILSGQIDGYSSSLPFDIFEKDWDSLPSDKKINKAYGKIYFDLGYNSNYDLKVGIFSQKEAYLELNDGFINTWYSATKDWTTLVNKKTFSDIPSIPIDGYGNYSYTKGIYLQKVLKLSNKHHISAKAKFFAGEQMQDIKTYGYNSETRFNLLVDYYYTDKNIITKSEQHDDSFSGYGYGFDLEYIYQDDRFYIYTGILNIGASIDWDSITYMHYEFDSDNLSKYDPDHPQVKLPLASGYYKFDISYSQKLPRYYKGIVDYKIDDMVSIGDSLFYYDKDLISNELYTSLNLKNSFYKLGYFYENKVVNFGYGYKNINIEVSNKFGTSNTILNGSYKISF